MRLLNAQKIIFLTKKPLTNFEKLGIILVSFLKGRTRTTRTTHELQGHTEETQGC